MGLFEDLKKKKEAREQAIQSEKENAQKLAELQVNAANFYELFKLKTSAMQAKIGSIEKTVNEQNKEVVVAYTEYGPITRTELPLGDRAYQTTSKHMYEGVVPGNVVVKDKKLPSGYYAVTATRGWMRDPDDYDHYPNSISWHRYNGFTKDFGTGKASFIESHTDERKTEEMDAIVAYFEGVIAKLEKEAKKTAAEKDEQNQPNA